VSVKARSNLYIVWNICVDLRDPNRSRPEGEVHRVGECIIFVLFKTGYITSSIREMLYIYVCSWCSPVSVLFYLKRIWAAHCPVFITRHLLILSHSINFPHSNISILHYLISWVTDIFPRSSQSCHYQSTKLLTLLHMFVFLYNVHVNSIFLRLNKSITEIDSQYGVSLEMLLL
jgi:hypothetical protein